MRHMFAAACLTVALAALAASGAAPAKGPPPGHGHGKGKGHGSMSVFATGFNNPRGLAFGPDGDLYVAEGGLGGTHDSSTDNCPQAHGPAAPLLRERERPGAGRSHLKGQPVRSRLDGRRRAAFEQTSPALGSLVSGVSSVAFVGNQLYGLLAGAGCSHGVPDIPNGVFRVDSGGAWSLIADLSAFQMANPSQIPTRRTSSRTGRGTAWLRTGARSTRWTRTTVSSTA